MTVVTTVLLGIVYPLVITGLAQVLFPDQANGQLIERNGTLIGSRIIGQPFSSPGYFYSRPSAAGSGYDAGASSGSNLGPTNKKLIDRVAADVARLQAGQSGAGADRPGDHLRVGTRSAYQPRGRGIPGRARRARTRPRRRRAVRQLVAAHTEGRQFGILGEPVVNVLMLNLALDERSPMPR